MNFYLELFLVIYRDSLMKNGLLFVKLFKIPSKFLELSHALESLAVPKVKTKSNF